MVFALICIALGWVMREFLLFGLFFMGGGAYLAIHAAFMLLTRKT
jgi:hypothetical protein